MENYSLFFSTFTENCSEDYEMTERVACKVKMGNTDLDPSLLTLDTYLRCFNREYTCPRFFMCSTESKSLML